MIDASNVLYIGTAHSTPIATGRSDVVGERTVFYPPNGQEPEVWEDFYLAAGDR